MCPSRAHITSEYHNRHRDYQCPLDWKFHRNRETRLSLRRDIMIYDGVTCWDDDEILCSLRHHLMIVPSLYNPRSHESSFNGRDIIFMGTLSPSIAVERDSRGSEETSYE